MWFQRVNSPRRFTIFRVKFTKNTRITFLCYSKGCYFSLKNIFQKSTYEKKVEKENFCIKSPKKVKPLLIWHNWQLPAIPGKNALKEVTERSLECLLLRNDVNLAKKNGWGGGAQCPLHHFPLHFIIIIIYYYIQFILNISINIFKR